MGSIQTVLGFLVLLSVSSYGNCARILGFFPYSGYSHFVIFQSLMEELAAKGHDVTVVSHFPHKNPPARYKEISLEGLQPIRVHIVDLKDFDSPPPLWLRPYLEFYFLSFVGREHCDSILPSDQIKKIINSKGDYDLVVIEDFITDCFLPVVKKLQVPIVGISSCGAMPWSYTRLGNPTDPSSVANIFTGLSGRMSLVERIENMIFSFITSNTYYYVYERPAEILIEKHLGERVKIAEMAKNTSLLLVNTHFSLHQPKPHLPSVIEIGGIHVKPAKPLPKDLETFLNGAEHGVIVFSLGSMLDVRTMTKEKMLAFLKVFKTLRQRVVWKMDGTLEDLPENVLTVSWLPQRDILAHDNVKAFIAHGGLLGLTEAVVSGKPVVAIPMFGDQFYNARAAEESGVAVQLKYAGLCEQTIRTAIETVLTDRYQQRAKKLAEIFNDRLASSKDSAVYWIEYVLRHGSSSLRTVAADLSWIEYYMIDAIALTIFSLILVTYLPYKLIRLILKVKKQKQE